MAHSATYIAVGGEAYSPLGQPLPPMGNIWSSPHRLGVCKTGYPELRLTEISDSENYEP